jgi:hypothetical protein
MDRHGAVWVRRQPGAWQRAAMAAGPVEGFAAQDSDTAHVLAGRVLLTVKRG